MSKKMILLWVILFSCALFACNSDTGSSSASGGSSDRSESETGSTAAKNSSDYVFMNMLTGASMISAADGGLYYTKMQTASKKDQTSIYRKTETTAIYYMDLATNTSLMLCIDASCTHDSEDCVACSMWMLQNTLVSDEDYLYYIKSEDEYSDEAQQLIEQYLDEENPVIPDVDYVAYYSKIKLCRVKKDGSSKDELAELGTALNKYYFYDDAEISEDIVNEDERESVTVSNMKNVDGNIYYVLEVDGTATFNCYNIALNSITKFCEEDGGDQDRFVMDAGEGYVWIQRRYLTESGKAADIYGINLAQGSVKKVVSGIDDVRTYGMSVCGNKMYYSSNGQMWYTDYDSGEKNVICEYALQDKTYYSPVGYGNTLIVCRMDCLELYDLEGNLETTLEFTEEDVTSGGEVNMPYIALMGVDSAGMAYIMYYAPSFDEDPAENYSVYTLDMNKAISEDCTYKKIM